MFKFYIYKLFSKMGSIYENKNLNKCYYFTRIH